MTLKITKGTEPITINTLVVTLYGAPGNKKTSAAQTAKRPLTLDTDNGIYRAMGRKDAVRVQRWEDIAAITADDLTDYDTVVLDTVGRALDMLAVHLIDKDPKLGTTSGALGIKGYGALKTSFTGWLNRLRSFGKDVVLIAHMDEQKTGDEVKERLDVQGGSKNEIYKVADMMGRLYTTKNGSFLSFDPSETAFGKNPAQFDPEIRVPNFRQHPDFLAGLIAQAKAKINELSAEQKEVSAHLTAWRDYIGTLSTPEEFTHAIEAGADVDPRIKETAKAILMEAARAHGFTYDKKVSAFVGKPVAA